MTADERYKLDKLWNNQTVNPSRIGVVAPITLNQSAGDQVIGFDTSFLSNCFFAEILSSSTVENLSLSNFTSDGSIGAAGSTVDIYDRFTFNQTTASVTVDVPDPTTPVDGQLIYFINRGTNSITVNNGTDDFIVIKNGALTLEWSDADVQWLENTEIVDYDFKAYSWVERVQDTAGTWRNGNKSGTDNAYLAEPSTGDYHTVPNNTVVVMKESKTVDGEYDFIWTGSGGGGDCFEITGFEWSADVLVFTIPGHDFIVGDSIIIGDVVTDDVDVNGTYTVTVVDGEDVSVDLVGDPGLYVSGGLACHKSCCEEIEDNLCGRITNVCSIPIWIAINDGFIVTSDVEVPGYTMIPGGGGLTIERHGYCGGVVTDASWASSLATITVVDHPLATGDTVTITGINPSGYNGTFVVGAVGPDIFQIDIFADPGTYVSGGLVSAPDVVYCEDNPDDCCVDSPSFFSLNCFGDCLFSFPMNLQVTLSDLTGTVIDGYYSAPFQVTLSDIGGDTYFGSHVLVSPDGFDFIQFDFTVFCDGGELLPIVRFDLFTNPFYGATYSSTAITAWVDGGVGQSTKLFACGDTWNPVNEEICDVEITGGSSPDFTTTTFTVKVNLG